MNRCKRTVMKRDALQLSKIRLRVIEDIEETQEKIKNKGVFAFEKYYHKQVIEMAEGNDVGRHLYLSRSIRIRPHNTEKYIKRFEQHAKEIENARGNTKES